MHLRIGKKSQLPKYNFKLNGNKIQITNGNPIRNKNPIRK